jgi:hypothetical protein
VQQHRACVLGTPHCERDAMMQKLDRADITRESLPSVPPTGSHKSVTVPSPDNTLRRDVIRAVVMLLGLIALWAVTWDRFQ